MKRIFYPVVALCCMLLAQQASAQVRYKDMIFDSVSKTTVTYSTANSTSLAMDIFEPKGDSACARPVLVLAHGGSFIPPVTRTDDPTINSLCQNFARRGYVTVSIDYRLGNPVSMALDSSYAINEVLQAISDAKAAVRYLRKDAYTANQFRIDTNYIMAGGNSAGAVLFMHYIFIDSVNEAPASLRQIIIDNGGLEGNSGNDGYSSAINAVLSLAGGLNIPELVGPGSKPIAHFHGTVDNVVPYNCGLAENGLIKVRLCGLGATDGLYNSNGVTHISVPFPGDGHVPWDGNVAKFTKVDTMSANFLDSISNFPAVTYNCTATGLKEVSDNDKIRIFPNPAHSMVNVSFIETNSYNQVQLLDEMGRLLVERTVSSTVAFDGTKYAPGMYLIRVTKKDGSTYTRKIIFE